MTWWGGGGVVWIVDIPRKWWCHLWTAPYTIYHLAQIYKHIMKFGPPLKLGCCWWLQNSVSVPARGIRGLMSESTLYFSKELNLGEQPIVKILLRFWAGQYNTKIHLSIPIWIMVICAAYNLHVKCDDDQNLSYCYVETSSFSIEKWYLRSLLMCLNYQWPANQTSYLSRISRIIFVEKKLSCGEISAFYTEFEQFMEFYRSLCCFCSKSVQRKICAEEICV